MRGAARIFDDDANLATSDYAINATADSNRARTRAGGSRRLKGEAMKLRTLALSAAGALVLAAPAAAVESPPSGIPPHVFATQYSGCLGQLRSKIAQGDFAGIGPSVSTSPVSSTRARTKARSERRSFSGS